MRFGDFTLLIGVFVSVLSFGCGSTPLESEAPIKGGQVKLSGQLEEQLVELFVSARSFDAASPLAQKLYQDRPNDARPAYLLGVILREKGVFEESKRFLLEAISRDPSHSDAYDALGILYGVQGQIKEAITAHQKATVLSPKQAKYWHNYGFALSMNRDFKEAIKSFQTALSLAPDQKRSFVNLAFAYGALGQYDEMHRYLSQALSEAEVEFNIGMMREKRGERREALTHYQKSLLLNQHLAEAREAIKRLQL